MRHTRSPIGVAADLLAALRAAGCKVFIDDGDLFCSPPLRPIAWPGNAEQAFESWYDDPKALVANEAHSANAVAMTTIH